MQVLEIIDGNVHGLCSGLLAPGQSYQRYTKHANFKGAINYENLLKRASLGKMLYFPRSVQVYKTRLHFDISNQTLWQITNSSALMIWAIPIIVNDGDTIFLAYDRWLRE